LITLHTLSENGGDCELVDMVPWWTVDQQKL